MNFSEPMEVGRNLYDLVFDVFSTLLEMGTQNG